MWNKVDLPEVEHIRSWSGINEEEDFIKIS
jgi:hypothetical protein